MPTSERIAVITEATSGIGRATALALAELGFRLFLIGRHRRRGERVMRACRQRHPRHRADFVSADLADLAQVRVAVEVIGRACEQIDVLVNNAGARHDSYEKSPQGIERTFAANHRGHFLLTYLLRGRLEQSGQGRVITVASGVHTSADLTHGWFPDRTHFNRHHAYANSKLANVVFGRELAARANAKVLTSNIVDPGFVATRFASNNGVSRWLKHLIAHAMRRELISAAAGADTVIYLSHAPEAGGLTGGYFRRRMEISPSALAQDSAIGRDLWSLSCRLVGFKGADSVPDSASSCRSAMKNGLGC